MKKKEIEKKITIGVNEVKFLRFELTTRALEINKQLDVEKYHFQYNINTSILDKDKICQVILNTTLFEKQEETIKLSLANMDIEMKFKIHNYDEIIFKHDNNLRVPNILFPLVSGVTISTARGMFAMCVKDTIISNATIPMIDAGKIKFNPPIKLK